MAAKGYDSAVQNMLAEAGFEPCFARDLVDGDEIAIRHETDPDSPTLMTITEFFRPGYVARTGIGHTQWIGVLPATGRKVHCDYRMEDPVWRQPRPESIEEPVETIPFPFSILEGN